MDVERTRGLGESLTPGGMSGCIGVLTPMIGMIGQSSRVRSFGRVAIGLYAAAGEGVERNHGVAQRVAARLVRTDVRLGGRAGLVEQAWSTATDHDMGVR